MNKLIANEEVCQNPPAVCIAQPEVKCKCVKTEVSESESSDI